MQMIKSAVMNMLKSVESSSLAQEDSRDPCEGLLAATASNLMGLVVLLRREVLATARQLAGEVTSWCPPCDSMSCIHTSVTQLSWNTYICTQATRSNRPFMQQ